MVIFLYSQIWGKGIETPIVIYSKDADVDVLCTNASSNDSATLRLLKAIVFCQKLSSSEMVRGVVLLYFSSVSYCSHICMVKISFSSLK